jgi:hypothetical protein
LTWTATGFNIDWKGGDIIATKDIIRQIKLARKSHKRSVSIGTTHALDILGKSSCAICPLHERVETSQSAQTSPGINCPQYSESTKESMPPPPQHTKVERPTGELPQSWSNVPTINGSTDIDSAEQHTTAKENLPAQARENMVEEKRGSRKHGRASQSKTTRVPTATST